MLRKVSGKINVEECAFFPCKCALWSCGPLQAGSAGNYNIFTYWSQRKKSHNSLTSFAVSPSNLKRIGCVRFVYMFDSDQISETNDHMCMKFAVHVWHIAAVLPVKAASIRLAIYYVTTLSSVVLTVKIQLTGEIIRAWQSISLYWKNTPLIAFGIKFYLRIMSSYLPNQHEEYCGLIYKLLWQKMYQHFGCLLLTPTLQVFIFTVTAIPKMFCLWTWCQTWN